MFVYGCHTIGAAGSLGFGTEGRPTVPGKSAVKRTLSESDWRHAKESGRHVTVERPGLLTGCCSRSKVESGLNLAGNWCNRVHFSTAFIQVSAARSTRCLKRVSSMTFF